jgi:hypothetical protein
MDPTAREQLLRELLERHTRLLASRDQPPRAVVRHQPTGRASAEGRPVSASCEDAEFMAAMDAWSVT